MLTDVSTVADDKLTARSAITNGTRLLSGVDGRSRVARRYRDLTDGLLAQLGEPPNEANLSLARRCATMMLWSEAEEDRLARGEAIDMAAFTTTANTLRRLLSDLGITAGSSARRKRRNAPRTTPASLGGVA